MLEEVACTSLLAHDLALSGEAETLLCTGMRLILRHYFDPSSSGRGLTPTFTSSVHLPLARPHELGPYWRVLRACRDVLHVQLRDACAAR